MRDWLHRDLHDGNIRVIVSGQSCDSPHIEPKNRHWIGRQILSFMVGIDEQRKDETISKISLSK